MATSPPFAGEEAGEDKGVFGIPSGEAARLRRDAIEPFETDFTHPNGSSGALSGEEIDGCTDAEGDFSLE